MKRTPRPKLPVSARFYSRLAERVKAIYTTLASPAEADTLASALMNDLQAYMLDGTTPAASAPGYRRIIFVSLKAEIDTAIDRSRRARERAALKAMRPKKESAIAGDTLRYPRVSNESDENREETLSEMLNRVYHLKPGPSHESLSHCLSRIYHIPPGREDEPLGEMFDRIYDPHRFPAHLPYNGGY